MGVFDCRWNQPVDLERVRDWSGFDLRMLTGTKCLRWIDSNWCMRCMQHWGLVLQDDIPSLKSMQRRDSFTPMFHDLEQAGGIAFESWSWEISRWGLNFGCCHFRILFASVPTFTGHPGYHSAHQHFAEGNNIGNMHCTTTLQGVCHCGCRRCCCCLGSRLRTNPVKADALLRLRTLKSGLAYWRSHASRHRLSRREFFSFKADGSAADDVVLCRFALDAYQRRRVQDIARLNWKFNEWLLLRKCRGLWCKHVDM